MQRSLRNSISARTLHSLRTPRDSHTQRLQTRLSPDDVDAICAVERWEHLCKTVSALPSTLSLGKTNGIWIIGRLPHTAVLPVIGACFDRLICLCGA